jgi:HEAT repeat protein
MKFTMLLIMLSFGLLNIEAVKIRGSSYNTESPNLARCFQGGELNESLTALKLQGGPLLVKASRSLLVEARTPGCRAQVVQALITNMEEASKNLTNPYENYFFFKNGASLLKELKATEALDLLIANIDLNDGYPSSLDDFPAFVAIVKIGEPAIPKLQLVLSNSSDPVTRKFAAFAIAYIGGSEAKNALTSALSRETDPCVKNLLQVSLQAFDNKPKPNHISSKLNGKWLSAFYCR